MKDKQQVYKLFLLRSEPYNVETEVLGAERGMIVILHTYRFKS